MLVISRKLGERIIVSDDVEVTVLQIREKKVRLGVTAPRSISVKRLEVREGLPKPIPSNESLFPLH